MGKSPRSMYIEMCGLDLDCVEKDVCVFIGEMLVVVGIVD